MNKNDLILSQKLYDFTKWTTGHTANFPKSHRYSYAVKIENILLETILLVEQANRATNKEPFMKRIDFNLHSLNILLRLSFELKFLSSRSYEFALSSLGEIGKIFGGWWKKFKG